MDLQNHPSLDDGINLRETVAVLFRRKLLILFTTFAFFAAAAGMSMQQQKVYSSSANIVIRPVIPPAALQSYFSATGPLGIDFTADTEAQIARSQAVSDLVAKELQVADPTQLPGGISVKVVTDSLLSFTGSSTDPRTAAVLAQAYATNYLQYRRNQAQAALETIAIQAKQQVDALSTQIAEMSDQILELSVKAAQETSAAARQAAIAEYNQLNSTRNQLQFQLASYQSRHSDIQGSMTAASTGGGTIVQQAAIPTVPSSPKPLRDGILGLILGMIVGVGLAFLRQHFDDRIHNLGTASKAVGTLVLGAIPRSTKWRNARHTRLETLEDPSSPAAEAYRSLRQALSTMGVGKELHTVLVTSATPGEGKSTSTANLGVAFARSGLRTIVVSADLQKPRLHAFFGVENRDGLSEVLAGKIWLDNIAPTPVPNLWILPSGAVPSNRGELMDGDMLGHVLAALESVVDVVLI
ncbi:MAG TPA: Wzz/FepE/Etk N-terminal domain-containing protein, partial [Actinomycetota bacterium]|nr:Wzz/FepE/Etk N-terminal domain-containing protein [Actinomycetota bacterium]